MLVCVCLVGLRLGVQSLPFAQARPVASLWAA